MVSSSFAKDDCERRAAAAAERSPSSCRIAAPSGQQVDSFVWPSGRPLTSSCQLMLMMMLMLMKAATIDWSRGQQLRRESKMKVVAFVFDVSKSSPKEAAPIVCFWRPRNLPACRPADRRFGANGFSLLEFRRTLASNFPTLVAQLSERANKFHSARIAKMAASKLMLRRRSRRRSYKVAPPPPLLICIQIRPPIWVSWPSSFALPFHRSLSSIEAAGCLRPPPIGDADAENLQAPPPSSAEQSGSSPLLSLPLGSASLESRMSALGERRPNRRRQCQCQSFRQPVSRSSLGILSELERGEERKSGLSEARRAFAASLASR